MLGHTSTSIRTPVFGLLAAALALTLTACGGGGGKDNPATATDNTQSTSDAPEPGSSRTTESCQAIVDSGAVKDVAEVFDRYKGNKKPFTDADAKKMRDALDRLAKAGDDAVPKVREAVVQLVADAGSLIDSRANLEGVGKVASVETVQREIDALCG